MSRQRQPLRCWCRYPITVARTATTTHTVIECLNCGAADRLVQSAKRPRHQPGDDPDTSQETT